MTVMVIKIENDNDDDDDDWNGRRMKLARLYNNPPVQCKVLAVSSTTAVT